MSKKLLALLIIAMLIVPATALAKGRPNIATSASESQSFINQDSGDDEEYSSERDKGKSARIANDSQDDPEESASGKDDKEALKEARKAEKEAEKESLKKQQNDDEDQQTGDVEDQDQNDVNSEEDSSAIESDDESGTAVKVKQECKSWEKDDSETADNESSDEDSSTATAHGKGIANAMSKIIRNIERMGDGASTTLKSVVNKFASWLGLPLPFPEAGTSGTTQAGAENTTTAGGTDTTCTAGPGSGITTGTTGSIGS